VAVRASREIVIEASPEAILNALADVEALPSYSAVHKRAEVVDRYADGKPYHVRVKVRAYGLSDTEVLEFRWGPDWLVWDAEQTPQQHAQHVEYTLRADPTSSSTRVRVDVTVEADLVPDFLIERASKALMDTATDGLRSRVLRG
jgi:hypothetical protein